MGEGHGVAGWGIGGSV